MPFPLSLLPAQIQPATSNPSLDALRTQAGRDPRAAARQVAVQFEAHFMETVFKGMRQAMAPGGEGAASGGMGDGGQQAFTGMLDAQFARQYAGRPGGLAAMIEQQLARQMHASPAGSHTHADPVPGTASRTAQVGIVAPAPAPAPASPPAPAAPPSAAPTEFLRRMQPHAEAAERATGVPASFILGHAALESGWGRHEPRQADGARSFNLFGIKAGRAWRGEVAVAATTEFEGGQPVRRQERFRHYGSYAQAFTDYARLIAGSARYAQALSGGENPAHFAGAMQRAGYATDPRYADKLTRTIEQAMALQSSTARVSA